GERPQMLSWLQLRRVGRQEEPVQVVGHLHGRAGMPARPIQHDLLLRPGADRLGACRQRGAEERGVDAGGQVKHGSARAGLHTADEVAPGVAVWAGGEGPLATRRPDLVQDRLEADTVFIDGPHLAPRLGAGHRHSTDQLADPPLNASWAAESAWT